MYFIIVIILVIEIRLGEGELTEEKIKDVLEKALEDMIESI